MSKNTTTPSLRATPSSPKGNEAQADTPVASATPETTASPDAPQIPLHSEGVARSDGVAAPESNLYTVASPIKHDGEDYAVGDPIRLPEATAHRLAGYLKPKD